MRRRAAALLATGVAAAIALVGCSGEPAPGPSPSPSESAAPAPSESAAPVEQTPAEAMLAQFADVLAANDVAGQPDGEAVVAALAAAGFDPAAIERSSDVDQQGEPVRLMTVAVRLEGECLLGQVGHGTPTTTIVPVLGTGTCLVSPAAP
ncbi:MULTISPECIES: DUF6993 domain-containing protein [unclassified Agrococcus]|uniref:DUF6993 domain-containing protein n=1 Tax=unclassified Agrococcus TaxID=2615065 RepID=UPI0036175E08